MKTLAIRLEDELHARLSVVAQLSESTISDEIRQAIEEHIERKMASDEFTSKAEAVLDDIERQANAKREAITAMFAKSDTGGTAKGSSKRTAAPKTGQ
jgi:predicted DNA-binding protein